MSQENVEVVRAAYAAFNRGDWDGVFRAADPEIEFTFEGAPDPRAAPGANAVQARIEDDVAALDALSYELDDLRESGEQVVALVRIRARPKGTTAEIENRVEHVWTLGDGAVVSIHTFAKRERALEVAGLSEQGMSQENMVRWAATHLRSGRRREPQAPQGLSTAPAYRRRPSRSGSSLREPGRSRRRRR